MNCRSSQSLPPSAAQPLAALLARNTHFAQLSAGIEQVTALKAELANLLPAYLAPHFSPGPIREGILTLLTAHNALACRLRHIGPVLLKNLQQRGWLVNTIKIRVQPAACAAPPALTQKEARLSKTGFACLKMLQQALAPSPLQTAVAQMLEHQAALSSAVLQRAAER